MRNLDWNMLNQVFVHGYFHADLHPANLFVLQGNAIGYVDYGIVGSLPTDTRDSLTHYSWLLFHGDVDAAVTELMRWLSPTSTTDPEAARSYLISVHRAFVYEMGAADIETRGEPPADAAASPARPAAAEPVLAPRDGHHARDPRPLADVLSGHRRLPEDAGDARDDPPRARHQLRPACQRAAASSRATCASERCRSPTHGWPWSGSTKRPSGIRRSVRFLEFIEAQEPFIVEAQSTLLGFRRRMQAVRRRLVQLGVAVLVIGAVLYFVLREPDETRRMLPGGVDYDLVQYGLVVVLLLLIARIVLHMRKLNGDD